MYFAGFDVGKFFEEKGSQLSSLFKIFIKSEKTGVPKFYALNIFKRLCSYYIRGERWFMLESPFSKEETPGGGMTLINAESEEISFLHHELGVDRGFLWEKLQEMIASNYQLADA